MANEYLKRQPTSSGNSRRWTVSFWMKNSNPTQGYTAMMGAGKLSPDNIYNEIWYSASEMGLNLDNASASDNYNIIANPLFRDPGSWMHVVASFTDQGDNANTRVRFYINGATVDNNTSTSLETAEFSFWNHSDYIHYIGSRAQQSAGTTTFDAQYFDIFMVDGQALTPDVFGFNKDGAGYISAGVAWETSSTRAYSTDFRPGQWSPHLPRKIKTEIERRGGFGPNGYYLPMNDSSNPGADFHCTPNSIIKLKGEDLPQPRSGAPTTSDVYVSQLREEKGSEDLPFEGVARFGGDGTNSSLKFPNHSDLDLGGAPFTAECWIYPIDTPANNYGSLFNKGFGFQVYWKKDIEALQLFASNDGSNYNMINGVTSQNGSVPKGKWCHIAVTRSGNNWYMFTNGKLTYGPLNVSGTIHNNTNVWAIGDYAPAAGNYEFGGFISDFRLVNGTAVYTAPFTPPTTRLTNITNTKLLCCQSSTNVTEAAVAPTTGGTAGGANTFATKNEMTGSISIVVPGISTTTGANLLTNGGFDDDISGWTTVQATTSWHQGMLRIVPNVAVNGGVYQEITTVVGKRYTVSMEVVDADPISNPPSPYARLHVGTSNDINSGGKYLHTASTSVSNVSIGKWTTSFTATTTYTIIWLEVGGGNQTRVDFDNVVCIQEDAPRDYSSDIRGSGSNLTLTPSGNAGVGYELDGYYGSAINLNATNGDEINVAGSSSNVDLQLGGGDFTIEAWVYPKVYNSGNMDWIGKNSGASNTSEFEYGILASGEVCFYHGDGSAYSSSGNNGLVLPAGTVPLGQWTHIATERHRDRFTVYINGVAAGVIQSFLGGGSMPSGSADLCIGNDSATNHASNWHWNGRVQDLRIYKGIAKYKGGFDVSKPYGPVGIESWRTTPDTSTNNFATLNPQAKHTKYTLSNGNLRFDATQNNWNGYVGATHGFRTGKWYWETRVNVTHDYHIIGVMNSELVNHDVADAYAYGMTYQYDGRFYEEDGNTSSFSNGNPTANAAGDIVSFAIDMDAKKMWVAVNGTWIGGGNPSTGSSPNFNSTHGFTDGPYYTPVFISYATSSITANFGQNPTFCGSISTGTNADDSGKGLFKYAPPTGFLSLCSDNLPTPTIPDPGKHFKTVVWTGDGKSGRSITDVGFKPDLVWIKPRNFSDNHVIFDSVTKTALYGNTNGTGNTSRVLFGYDSSGFSLESWNNINDPEDKYVAWCWKANGEQTVVNNDGSITSQVSVNQTAGFSIVKFTGDGGASSTVGHGLSKAPSFIISKNRDNTYGWAIYHKSTQNTGSSATDVVYLNENIVGNADNIRSVNDTTFAPTNWGGVNQSTKTHINYCWTEIEGFSRFGSYLGNGVNDGAFVYCGFRPAYVMIKNVSGTGEWCIWDSSRTPYNEMQDALRANSADGDVDGFQFDFLSNGFKARDTESSVNSNGSRYIFAAFAESPFQTANAK